MGFRRDALKAVLLVGNDIAGNTSLNRVLPELRARGHVVHVLLGDAPVAARGTQHEALRRQREMERDLFVDGLFPMLDSRGPVTGEPKGLLTFKQLAAKYGAQMDVVRGGINRGTAKGADNFDLLASLEADFLLSMRFPFMFKQPVIDLPRLGAFNIHPGVLPHFAGLPDVCPFQAMRLGESSIGATLHRIEAPGLAGPGPVVSVDHTPIDLQRSVMWHTAQVYPKGVRSFVRKVLPHLEMGRPDLVPARPLQALEHPPATGCRTDLSADTVEEGLEMGIKLSSSSDFDELAGLYHSMRVAGDAAATSTSALAAPFKPATNNTRAIKSVGARALHSSRVKLSQAVQSLGLDDDADVDRAPKAYVLGGFGGAASLDISSKLFKAGRNVHGGSEQMADSGDIKFVLDSHPGKEGHVTTEGCIAPLQAGLDRAAYHRVALGGGPIVVAIGCNTMHTALPLVEMPSGVHVVHIMAATARELRRVMQEPDAGDRAVLWSTMATAESGMYQRYCKSVARKELEVPERAHAEAVEQVIELTKLGGKNVNTAVALLRPILASYAPGTMVVLGCTELPLLMDAVGDAADHIKFVDCNGALANDTVSHYKALIETEDNTLEALA